MSLNGPAKREINALRAINRRFLWRRVNFALISVWGLVELRSCRGCRVLAVPNSENASMGVCSKRCTASESVSQLRGATNGEWARSSWGRWPSALDCERVFDLFLLGGSLFQTLSAIQFQDRGDMDLPDALLDRGFLFAFERLFVFAAAQLTLNLHVRSLLERCGEVGQWPENNAAMPFCARFPVAGAPVSFGATNSKRKHSRSSLALLGTGFIHRK